MRKSFQLACCPRQRTLEVPVTGDVESFGRSCTQPSVDGPAIFPPSAEVHTAARVSPVRPALTSPAALPPHAVPVIVVGVIPPCFAC